MSERRDLFGRTEAEVAASLEQRRRSYEISRGYTGSEGLAINLARYRGMIEVDERELARLRGKLPPSPSLSGAALAKWRREITAIPPPKLSRR